MKKKLYKVRRASKKTVPIQSDIGQHPGQSASAEDLSLREVATAYGVRQETFSRLTGFSLRAVAHWMAGKTPGAAAKIRVTELNRLLTALAQIIEPSAIEGWLQKPNPAFEGSTPLQVVERGESDRLWRMIYDLASGEPS